jgi:hypothetical protein
MPPVKRRNNQNASKMTGDQSRLLKPLDRVCWGATTTDLGTVIETDWAGVSINWDNGRTSSIQHNDMAQVERVPVKV